jgi:hypothetical protein
MSRPRPTAWDFTRRFRRGAFGWKSEPAIRAREYRWLLGAIGNAVTHAVEGLVAVIARAHASTQVRERWLERLWEAHANGEIPYIERLGDFWGDLCVTVEIASAWADRLVPIVELAWSPGPERRGYFHGTMACFSALFRAGRHAEILALLEKDPLSWWYRQWGVRALAVLGRPDAIAYAEASRGINDNSVAIAAAWPATRESGSPQRKSRGSSTRRSALRTRPVRSEDADAGRKGLRRRAPRVRGRGGTGGAPVARPRLRV